MVAARVRGVLGPREVGIATHEQREMTVDDAPTQFVNPAYLLESAPAADCAYANFVSQVHVIVHNTVYACFKETGQT